MLPVAVELAVQGDSQSPGRVMSSVSGAACRISEGIAAPPLNSDL
jgi:hypothetical protein